MTLEELVQEDETTAYYALEGYYQAFQCIVPKDKDIKYIDIGGCLENTLHRILEAGGKEDDVFFIMGAVPQTEEEAYPIDLGYVLAGDMLYIEKEEKK